MRLFDLFFNFVSIFKKVLNFILFEEIDYFHLYSSCFIYFKLTARFLWIVILDSDHRQTLWIDE